METPYANSMGKRRAAMKKIGKTIKTGGQLASNRVQKALNSIGRGHLDNIAKDTIERGRNWVRNLTI